MDSLPKLSHFILELRKEGHQWHLLPDGSEGIQFKLTKDTIDFLAPAIPKEKLLYKRGPLTRGAFPVTLIESIYIKFFSPAYSFNIPHTLAPGLCILAEATKRSLAAKKPQTKKQDYTKLAEMQRRFASNEFPKSVTIKFSGRDDSYTLSDQIIMLEFWEAFLNNVAAIEAHAPVKIELLLFKVLHPVVKSVGNTHLLIVDLLNICGNKEPITAGTIEKRIRDQIRQKDK